MQSSPEDFTGRLPTGEPAKQAGVVGTGRENGMFPSSSLLCAFKPLPLAFFNCANPFFEGGNNPSAGFL